MKNYFLSTLIIFLFITSIQTINSQNEEIKLSITDSIYSDILSESRDFWVQLPENYNPKSKEKYPVIYLLDGFSLRNNLEIVYDNYLGHYLPDMVLVGISNSTNRTRDLTTSQIKMRQGDQLDENTGGAEKFTQFIENELIPHIDANFPTTTYRTLIGHSYAGLFTINMMINHNLLFQNYIAIDPSLDWDNQKLLKQAKEKLGTENFKGKSLFVSLAAEQLHMWDEKVTIDNIMEDTTEFSLFGRSIIEFSEAIESNSKNGLNFSLKVYAEDLHGTVPLPSMMDGMVFLFNWFQFKNPPKYNNPETTVDELEKLLNEQEKIYTENFGYAFPPMIEELFTGYGYMNMQMGDNKKAKLFFEMGVKYYPKSANSFGSLAEYYESVKDYTNALKNIKIAFELSGSDTHKKRMEAIQVKN